MSVPFDTELVKREIEEAPCSDEDRFFSSINGCDSNSQSFGDDHDGDSDGVGGCSMRKRVIKRENCEEDDSDCYGTELEEDDEFELMRKKTKRGRQQTDQPQKSKTITNSRERTPSAKCKSKKVGGDTTKTRRSPGGGKRRSRVSEKEKNEREVGTEEGGIKKEVDSEEDTNKNKSTRSSGGGKRVTFMSVEEKKERERERKRLSRLREKERRQLENLEGEEDSEEEDAGRKVKRKRSSGGGGTRKKKVSEMTEEEKEHKRALWRQQAEKKRARRRELEGREKQRRGGNRKPKPLTPELLEHRRQQRNKWIREYRNRVKEDPEKWRKFKEKDSENRKLNRMRKKMEGKVGMGGEEVTEEERERRRMADYFRKQARLAGMTEEERERRREELKKKNKEKWEKIKETPGEYERIQEKRRKWREGLSDEKKERFLEKLRENARRQHEKWRSDPVKWQEMKERWRMKRAIRKVELEAGAEKKKFEWSEAMKKKFEEREREGLFRRKGTGIVLTEEENRRRLEVRRLADKKRSLQKKLWIQGLLDEGMSIEQIMQQTETPEHRSRRLSVQRIAKAKRDLRKRLQKFGAPPEEIQEKVVELERTYQPCKEINRYRQSWKRVDPKELEEVDKKLKIETEKFNEFLKSNRSKSINTTAICTTSTITPKIVVASGKVEILKNKNPLQIPSLFSNTTPPAPHPPLVGFHQPTPQLQNPYYSHQDFLHQFSFQSQPLPLQAPAPTSSSHYYPQTTSSTSTTTPHQSSHSLQSVLHTMDMKYHQNNSVSTSIPSQTNYQYDSSSSHHGLNSIYGDEDDGRDRDYSPPSPPNSTEDTYNYPPQPPPPPPIQRGGKRSSQAAKTKRQNPHITTNHLFDGSPNYQSYPRLKRDQVLRDVICDECGKPFNNQYIRAHKKMYHNPHYDPKTRLCLLCNNQLKFPTSPKWYQHYLRDHLNKRKESNTIVCDLCGKKFKSMLNYNKHIYFTHGDGLKPENKKKCPVCPDPPGRYFKENSSLQGHMARFHPNHSWASGKHKCSRCSEDFRNEAVLRQHVRERHKESYFTCEFCGTMKYTRLAINFHLSTGKCLKMPRGWGKKGGEIEMVEDCEVVSLDRVEVPCEVCGKRITVKSLMKHYKLVHNVEERQDWKCGECGKMYKRREGMVVHLEEVHGRRVDKERELMEEVRRLNQENREGLRMERRKKVGWGRKVKMERGEWDEEMRKRGLRGGGRMKRRIKVICEEDGEN